MENTETENADIFSIRSMLPWLIPLVFTILAAGFQLWSLIDKVAEIEGIQIEKGDSAMERLRVVENKVSRIEEMCCSEVAKYEEFIKEH